MGVRDLMQTPPVTARPDESVREAARRLAASGIGCLIVVDDQRRPIGILTDRDIAVRVLRRGLEPDTTAVGDVMSDDVSRVTDDFDVVRTLYRMRRDGFRRIVVTDINDRVAGIVSWDDALELISRELTAAAAVAGTQKPAATAEA